IRRPRRRPAIRAGGARDYGQRPVGLHLLGFRRRRGRGRGGAGPGGRSPDSGRPPSGVPPRGHGRRGLGSRSRPEVPHRGVTRRDFMSADAEGTAPAARPAGHCEVSGVSGLATALARVENWHHDVVAQVDGWGWIRTLNDQLTAVLAPWRERYQGNPVLELMHGGRWLGHPLHPALSDLPIGFWAGSALLDLTGGDPAPEGGLD